MRLLGPNTIGLVNLTDGIMLSATGALEVEEPAAGPDRAGLAERRHPRLAAVARRRPRHRLLQADLHRQRGRPRQSPTSSSTCSRTTPPRSSRSTWKALRKPDGLPPRRAAGRRARQAHRRLQGRAARKRAAAPPRPTPARWPAPTGCTTPCSASSASSAPRPSPTCSTSPARWPAAAAPPGGGWRS